jgi:pyridoxal/pyridoxine/pyridoxamine kinase
VADKTLTKFHDVCLTSSLIASTIGSLCYESRKANSDGKLVHQREYLRREAGDQAAGLLYERFLEDESKTKESRASSIFL